LSIFLERQDLKKEIADPQAIINFYNSAKDTSPLGVGTAPPPIVPASGPYPGPRAASSPLGSIFGGLNQQPAATQTAATQTAATQPTTVRPDSSGADFINPAATTPASRPGIERGFFIPPSYSDTAPLSVTSITPAPTAPGEPSPGQFSSERLTAPGEPSPGRFSTEGLTAPPIETSVSATGEPWTGAADKTPTKSEDSGITESVVTLAAVAGLPRAIKVAKQLKRAPALVKVFLRETAGMQDKAVKIARNLVKKIPTAQLARGAGRVGMAVAVDDLSGRIFTSLFNDNLAQNPEAAERFGLKPLPYGDGLLSITVRDYLQTSADPRGTALLKNFAFDEITNLEEQLNGGPGDDLIGRRISYLEGKLRDIDDNANTRKYFRDRYGVSMKDIRLNRLFGNVK
jgi:hypothetical protein